MAGPLSGFRVVDMTTWIFGPLATQILGDIGADVIKVESPEGDALRRIGPGHSENMSGMFLNINRNKRGIVLDIKKDADYAHLCALVGTADVFVHNMRLKAADKLRIDAPSIRAHNAEIVYAVGTGFDRNGPWKDRAAFDDIIQGASGVPSLSLKATGEARYAPMALADKLSAYALANGILAALLQRQKSGKGDDVYVPMLETMVSFNLAENLWNGIFPGSKRDIGYPRVLAPARKPYRTRDGFICVMASTDDQWQRLFVQLGTPHLAQDARFTTLTARSQHIRELYDTLSELLLTRTTVECERLLREADVPNSPMLDLDNVMDDPYLKEIGFFKTFEHPTEGPIVMPNFTTHFARNASEMRCLAPRLGADTDDIVRSLDA